MSDNTQSSVILGVVLLLILGSACASVRTPTTLSTPLATVSTTPPPPVEIPVATNRDLGLDENFDPFELQIMMRANGRVLKAYANAIAAFAGDSQIPMEKRNIENYDVEFRENRQYYFIYFAAHMSPSEKLNPKDSGETGLGKSVMYILSKDDLTIRRRYFFA